MFYNDEVQFVASIGGFITKAVADGASTLVALPSGKNDLLKSAVGNLAGVVFLDMEDAGRNPGRIISIWHDFLQSHPDTPVSGVGEPVWPGRDRAELVECRLHEHLLNMAFESSRDWTLLCPYDSQLLSPATVEEALITHPGWITAGGEALAGNSRHDIHARSILAGSLPPPPPDHYGIDFDVNELPKVREVAHEMAMKTGLNERAHDLAFSANEVATNSLIYGGGVGRLRTWTTPKGVVLEISDQGTIDDPLVGRIRSAPNQAGGRGLWMVNQLCDLVQIRSRARATRIRMRMNLPIDTTKRP